MVIVLDIKWSVSRGRDTYGYSICSLWRGGRKLATCNGGGYDMTGTVVAEWFCREFQAKVWELRSRASTARYRRDIGGLVDHPEVLTSLLADRLTGLEVIYTNSNCIEGKAFIDGACGLRSVQRLIEACGFNVEEVYNRRGTLTGLILTNND